MTSPTDFFQTSHHAYIYKQFRQPMPDQCVKKIIAFLSEKFDPSKCEAVDVGCGPGQSAFPLSPYLKKVLAVDVSEAQLAEANASEKPKNVEFKYGSAESLPVPDKSIHLVHASHAAHWFDLPTFFKEVDRVLVPGGILSLVASAKSSYFVGHEEEENKLYDELEERTKHYWSERSLNVKEFYKNMELPYRCRIRDESVEFDTAMSVKFYIERIKTFSGIAKFLEAEPEEAEKVVKDYQDKIMKMLGSEKSPEEAIFTYRKHYLVFLCRKP